VFSGYLTWKPFEPHDTTAVVGCDVVDEEATIKLVPEDTSLA
jgi:hypothetical protein